VWHVSFICVIWLIHMCDMTHSYVWHDSFICVMWLIHMCGMTFIRAMWLIHVCGMTHSDVWHDAFICVTRRIHLCDMTHSFVCHNSSICVTWLIYMCDMPHSYVWHDSFIWVPFIPISDLTHSTATCLQASTRSSQSSIIYAPFTTWPKSKRLAMHFGVPLGWSILLITQMRHAWPTWLFACKVCCATRVSVCVGCQKVWCILLHGVVCVFSHPTHFRRAWPACLFTNRVYCTVQGVLM